MGKIIYLILEKLLAHFVEDNNEMYSYNDYLNP